MRRTLYVGLLLAGVVLAATAFARQSGSGTARAARPHALTPMQQRLLSGAAAVALEGQGTARTRLHALRRAATAGVGPTSDAGCPADRGNNVHVNSNCQNVTDADLAGRGQAQNETAIAQDPNHPGRMIASSNDYRRGDGNCYSYYSSDGGKHWTDSTPPMSFTRGTAFGKPRQYWQAGGDTSVAWDTRGNAYLSCQMFNRGSAVSPNPDQSSAFYIFRSTGSGGASWNFPARPVAEFSDTAGAGTTLLDKQYLTVDNHKGSPYRDRLYVTWTLFDADGNAYIFEAHSSDYGESFSAPVLVSGDSALCPVPAADSTPTHGRCNSNQDSQPFTGPDGNLYVVFDNFNATGAGAGDVGGGDDNGAGRNAAPASGDNHDQVLLAKSTDGGATFSAPVKVADYYELPDCETYQSGADPGRSCVPEKGDTANSIFRATNYPSGAVNPRHPGEIDVTLGSYINRHSNESNGCAPQGVNPATNLPLYSGVKTMKACNNDIVVSRSTDGGATFTGTTADVRTLPSVRSDGTRGDQFWQWAAFDSSGRLAVSYYDRDFGSDERTGSSDISVSGTRDGTHFASRRVTSASMPPQTQFGGLFYGDYTGLSAANGVAHPVWMDTRDPELFKCPSSGTAPPSVCTGLAPNGLVANDENVYTRSLGIPLP
jgi:hypothetical protein